MNANWNKNRNNKVTVYSAGCFGKMPNHSDFIRYQAGGTEINLFDRWLQEGIHFTTQKLGERYKDYLINAPLYNFVFTFEKSENILIGSFISNKDKAGRVYPFIIFMTVRSSVIGNNLLYLPQIFSSFFNQAEVILREEWKDVSVKDLTFRIAQIQFSISEPLEDFSQRNKDLLKLCRNIEFWEGLFGNFNDTRKYQLIHNLAEIVFPLQRNGLRSLKLGIRFPLPLSSVNLQTTAVTFWIKLVQKMVKDNSTFPTIFWNDGINGKSQPGLLIFFSTPAPKNFMNLLQPDLARDLIHDLVNDGIKDSENVIGLLRKEHQLLLNDPDISLSDFLDRV